MSMLYYLRESALADEETMSLLGGSKETEAAVDKALKWLASAQHEDGYWSITQHGGKAGHDTLWLARTATRVDDSRHFAFGTGDGLLDGAGRLCCQGQTLYLFKIFGY